MWDLIRAALSLLARVFSSRIGGWIVSALVFFGLSVTSYKFGVAPFRAMIADQFSSAGFMVNWIGYFGVDQAVTITLSAIATKYAIGGAKAALTKRAA